MQRTIRTRTMSFDFNNNINPINKTQATYKDGGGLGGGGMYMRQQKKKQQSLTVKSVIHMNKILLQAKTIMQEYNYILMI